MKKKKTTAIMKKTMGTALAREVKKIESTGTAMMQTAQEFTLAVEEVLKKKFDFTQDDLKKFEQELRYILAITRQAEENGLSILSVHDMVEIGKIAELREVREKVDKARNLPYEDIQTFTKRLQGIVKSLPDPKKSN